MKFTPWVAPASCALLLTFSTSVGATETTTYEYDAQGRLTKSTKTDENPGEIVKTTDYDAAGNRTNQTVTGAPPPPPPSP